VFCSVYALPVWCGGEEELENSAPDITFSRCVQLRSSRESALWGEDQILVQVAGVPALLRRGVEVVHGGLVQGQ